VTIAGDNTIFVAVREGAVAADLRAELVGHLLEGAAWTARLRLAVVGETMSPPRPSRSRFVDNL
jgi:hypothetical protein